MALSRVWMLALLANPAAFGQLAGIPRTMAPVIAAPSAPTITILTTATGALVRRLGAGSSSIDLGQVSYFKGASAPGENWQKNPRSFVISTRFALRVDCPGASPSSKVNVTFSWLDGAPSHSITIDGATVGFVPKTFVQSMPCGSGGEHRMDVEVPISTPAGTIGSTIAFVATLNR